MISLGRLISTEPIPVLGKIKFTQPKLLSVLTMGESMYWSLLKIWDLKRSEMIEVETPESKELSDFEIWQTLAFHVSEFQMRIRASVDYFLNTKIEFLPYSNTIMIGETDTSILLDEAFYLSMQEICQSIFNLGESKKEEQYQEHDNMTDQEKRLIAKMKANAEKLDRIKNGEKSVEDRLVKQIVSLVAIGHYSFDEVYNMTLIQMITLLKKYVEIQQYELVTALSPYMDSKKGQGVKHWLDT